MAFVLSGQRSRRVKHSCPVDTKKKETHLQDENIALYQKGEQNQRENCIPSPNSLFRKQLEFLLKEIRTG